MKKMNLVSISLLCATVALAQENYSQWAHYKDIRVNTSSSGANTSTNVTQFPLLVRLDSTNADVFSGALANGADVRFTKTNHTTRLPHQRERWDATNKRAEFWVLVDTIPAGNNSLVTLRMYWGKAGAADSSNGGQVFATSNHFQAVFHLNENAGDTARDATGKFKGVPIGTAPANVTSNVSGQFISGSAKSFGGNGTDITTGGAYRLMTAAGTNTDSSMDFVGTGAVFTVSAWVNIIAFPSGSGFRPGIVTKAAGSGTTNTNIQWQMRATEHNSGSFNFLRISENPTPGYIVTRPDAAGVWTYVSYSANAATINFGAYNATGAPTIINPVAEAGVHQDVDVVIGAFAGGTGTATGTNYLNGSLDEVVISDTARSADWAQLSYSTQMPGVSAVIVGPTDAVLPIRGQGLISRGAGLSASPSGSGMLFRFASAPTAERVSVFDIWGRQVWSQNVAQGMSQLSWDGKSAGRSLSAGIYLVRLTTGDLKSRVLAESKIALSL